MAAEPEHGTQPAVNRHKRDVTPLCPKCSVFHADYQRGRRIIYAGAKRYTTISAGSLARLLRGEPADQVLASEYGPCTLAALHEIGGRGEPRA